MDAVLRADGRLVTEATTTYPQAVPRVRAIGPAPVRSGPACVGQGPGVLRPLAEEVRAGPGCRRRPGDGTGPGISSPMQRRRPSGRPARPSGGRGVSRGRGHGSPATVVRCRNDELARRAPDRPVASAGRLDRRPVSSPMQATTRLQAVPRDRPAAGRLRRGGHGSPATVVRCRNDELARRAPDRPVASAGRLNRPPRFVTDANDAASGGRAGPSGRSGSRPLRPPPVSSISAGVLPRLLRAVPGQPGGRRARATARGPAFRHRCNNGRPSGGPPGLVRRPGRLPPTRPRFAGDRRAVHGELARRAGGRPVASAGRPARQSCAALSSPTQRRAPQRLFTTGPAR